MCDAPEIEISDALKAAGEWIATEAKEAAYRIRIDADDDDAAIVTEAMWAAYHKGRMERANGTDELA